MVAGPKAAESITRAATRTCATIRRAAQALLTDLRQPRAIECGRHFDEKWKAARAGILRFEGTSPESSFKLRIDVPERCLLRKLKKKLVAVRIHRGMEQHRSPTLVLFQP